MNSLLRRIADNTRPGSLADRLRCKRFELFRSLVKPGPEPVSVLDVGGTLDFWRAMGFDQSADYRVVLLNLTRPEQLPPGFRAVVGDASDLSQFEDREFDVVFSNSVVEHLGDFESQRRMAQEVQRVGSQYFVQTPNRFFPLEPHYLVPCFQFFPVRLQVELIRHLNLGWYRKIPDRSRAEAHVRSHRLLTEAELTQLFPEGALYREKIFGLTKSLIAYGDSPAA